MFLTLFVSFSSSLYFFYLPLVFSLFLSFSVSFLPLFQFFIPANILSYLFIYLFIKNKYKISSTLVQHKVGSRDEMRWSPLDYRPVSSKSAGRPRLTHHHKGLMKWNEMDEMRVEKWWNEICGRGKREKPREKPTQTPFRLPWNPHGVTETRTRDPSGGRRAPNRLRHEAATKNNIWVTNRLIDWNFVMVSIFKN